MKLGEYCAGRAGKELLAMVNKAGRRKLVGGEEVEIGSG